MRKDILENEGFGLGPDGVWRKRHDWLTAEITSDGKKWNASIKTKTGTAVADPPDGAFKKLSSAVSWAEDTITWIRSRTTFLKAQRAS